MVIRWTILNDEAPRRAAVRILPSREFYRALNHALAKEPVGNREHSAWSESIRFGGAASRC